MEYPSVSKGKLSGLKNRKRKRKRKRKDSLEDKDKVEDLFQRQNEKGNFNGFLELTQESSNYFIPLMAARVILFVFRTQITRG